MRRRKAEALLSAFRFALGDLLAKRAEALTEERRFVGRRWVPTRTAWPIIQAAAFVEARRWAGVRTVGPGRGLPAALLGVASASNLGMGERGQRRGAKQRLAVLLCVAGRLVAWRSCRR